MFKFRYPVKEFLSFCAYRQIDKAHRQIDRQTDRHQDTQTDRQKHIQEYLIFALVNTNTKNMFKPYIDLSKIF